MISLQKKSYIHRIYMVLANPKNTLWFRKYGQNRSSTAYSHKPEIITACYIQAQNKDSLRATTGSRGASFLRMLYTMQYHTLLTLLNKCRPCTKRRCKAQVTQEFGPSIDHAAPFFALALECMQALNEESMRIVTEKGDKEFEFDRTFKDTDGQAQVCVCVCTCVCVCACTCVRAPVCMCFCSVPFVCLPPEAFELEHTFIHLHTLL
jgi:hypothetical protein